jgi:hypothetical protein
MITLKTCYDMLDQINEGILLDIFSEDDIVQVLRDDKALYLDYYPIIFLYPEDSIIKKMNLDDEFYNLYLRDYNKLESIQLKQAKFELEEISDYLKQ